MDRITLTPALEKLLRDVNVGQVFRDPDDPTIIRATYQRYPRTVTDEVNKARRLGLIVVDGDAFQLTDLGTASLMAVVRRNIADLVSASRAPRAVRS